MAVVNDIFTLLALCHATLSALFISFVLLRIARVLVRARFQRDGGVSQENRKTFRNKIFPRGMLGNETLVDALTAIAIVGCKMCVLSVITEVMNVCTKIITKITQTRTAGIRGRIDAVFVRV